MFPVFMSAYPWDLLDEGIEPVLDRLQGELGVTGVSFWVGCPPVLQFRAREVEPRVVYTRGGLFFQPDEACYAATRCKPIVAEGFRGKDPLRRVAAACVQRSLSSRAVLSASATGAVAHRHPELACKNAFGAVSEEGICLANPDAQAWLCGLLTDLSADGSLSGIVLTDLEFAWREAFSPTLRTAMPIDDTQRRLLSLCICESCRQAAGREGVDAGLVQRSIRTHLQRSMSGAPATSARLQAALGDDSLLSAFDRWRGNLLTELLRRLKEACRCDLVLLLEGQAPRCGPSALPTFAIPSAVATRIERPEQLSAARPPGAARHELCLAESLVGGAQDGPNSDIEWHSETGPGRATPAGADRLVSTLAEAARLGFAAAQLDHYGLLPEHSFPPIKQAIRFARRTG